MAIPAPRPTRSTWALMPALAVLLTACWGGGDASNGVGGELRVERSMDGDTAVVHVLAGSTWGAEAELVPEVTIGVIEGDERYMFGAIHSIAVGEDGRIFVMDGQLRALRVYDADGSWVGDWGRSGQGPGEFQQPDGGLTVLSDGRVVVRDPGNARLQVFSPDGSPLATWPVIHGGFNTGSPFYRHGDTIMTSQVVNLGEVAVQDWQSGLVRISPSGEVLDTLDIPTVDFEPARIVATLDGGTSMTSVPWSIDEAWAWHPDGFFIHGVSDQYSFTLLRDGAPARFERTFTPIPVTTAERAQAVATSTQSMRRTDPNWRWNGPEIPAAKPAFDALFAGKDGRIWVYRQGEAYEVEDPNYDPSDPDAIEIRWREDRLFDVWEDDGTFLGTVRIPRDLSMYPAPVLDGDRLWATTRDDLGVQRVVRYRVSPVEEAAGT